MKSATRSSRAVYGPGQRMTYRGRTRAPPTFQAAGTKAVGAGDISVTWPAHTTNDIGVLLVTTNNQPVATPAGWNAVANGSQGVGVAGTALGVRLQVFWRRAGSGAESAAVIVAASTFQGGVILTFRGCVTSGNPINVSAGDATPDADSTAVAIPGATTTVANCLVVAACSATYFATQSGETNASLTGLAERFDNFFNVGGGLSIVTAVTGAKVTAGAYSVTTATLSAAKRQGRVSLALLPA